MHYTAGPAAYAVDHSNHLLFSIASLAFLETVCPPRTCVLTHLHHRRTPATYSSPAMEGGVSSPQASVREQPLLTLYLPQQWAATRGGEYTVQALVADRPQDSPFWHWLRSAPVLPPRNIPTSGFSIPPSPPAVPGSPAPRRTWLDPGLAWGHGPKAVGGVLRILRK